MSLVIETITPAPLTADILAVAGYSIDTMGPASYMEVVLTGPQGPKGDDGTGTGSGVSLPPGGVTNDILAKTGTGDGEANWRKLVFSDIETILPPSEPPVSSGTLNDYYRGDKTWAPLAVVARTGSYNDLTDLPAATGVPDATDSTKGAIKLAGDLSGTADVPSVPGLASKANSVHAHAKTEVGLSNVDNTADLDKPISTATQAALDAKADKASPTFTGTVSGITKAMVGLSNVDNTADLDKPISTATQAALDAKADKASPTFTGTVSGVTKSMVGLGSVDNTSDLDKPISTATQAALDAKADKASPTFTGTVSGITKAMVGLGNVDNTSDVDKPISTATQGALNLKANTSSLATVATTGQYSDLQGKPSIPTVVDASTTQKGIIKLAGALGGTADAPTIPSLANYVLKSEAMIPVKWNGTAWPATRPVCAVAVVIGPDSAGNPTWFQDWDFRASTGA